MPSLSWEELEQKKVQDLCSEIRKAGDYFTVSRPLAQLISMECAFVVYDILNLASFKGRAGWVSYSAQEMKHSVGASIRSQKRILAELIKHGLIKSKRTGAKGSRFLKVRTGRLRQMIQEATQTRREAETVPSRILANSQMGRNRTISGAETVPSASSLHIDVIKSKKHCTADADTERVFVDKTKDSSMKPKVENPVFTEWCKRLYKALSEKGLITKKKTDYLKKKRSEEWSKQFSRLLAELEDDKDRIERVLFWYCRNIKKPFVPFAFCAASFREKFFNIEAVKDQQAEKKRQHAQRNGDQLGDGNILPDRLVW